ncbi:hypothetical protein BCR44DRAFT_330559 [Catenaria anguillulae PL171]|uniref:Uncharacterized protein n=1 Tax=Catenaria anguillulae PL171 TaxID=765915 RepID=A0A1Y2HL49_9FUNG|nr:hypothetical protein BCR44DRAFT_330559 [Catenaria anguillulae PL171]
MHAFLQILSSKSSHTYFYEIQNLAHDRPSMVTNVVASALRSKTPPNPRTTKLTMAMTAASTRISTSIPCPICSTLTQAATPMRRPLPPPKSRLALLPRPLPPLPSLRSSPPRPPRQKSRTPKLQLSRLRLPVTRAP